VGAAALDGEAAAAPAAVVGWDPAGAVAAGASSGVLRRLARSPEARAAPAANVLLRGAAFRAAAVCRPAAGLATVFFAVVLFALDFLAADLFAAADSLAGDISRSSLLTTPG
jgi:hypothetical protein